MAIIVCGEDTPSRPTIFEERLQAFDKDLLVIWHRPPTQPRHKPGRWKIEQCIEHLSGLTKENGMPEHTHVCRRIYVMMVQDDEGTALPLGEHVIEKLRAMRAYSESFGGETERGLKNFIHHSNNLDKEMEQKREISREDITQHNRKFNRVSFNRAWNMIERHNLEPNK